MPGWEILWRLRERSRRLWARLPLPVILAAVVLAVVVAQHFGRDTRGEAERVSTRFFQALRGGNPAAAYALLSAARQGALDRAGFQALTDHPAFLTSTDAVVDRATVQPDGYCVEGWLHVGGQPWKFETFVVDRGAGARVESFAIQPPTPMPLRFLVPECGYWEGTTAGYHGPGIARTTRALH